MYSYTTTESSGPVFNKLDTLSELIKRAAFNTFKNEGFDGYKIIYDELMVRPITMLLTSRTKKELDEIFFNQHVESAGPFLLSLKININYLASSDDYLNALLDTTLNNIIVSIVSVTSGIPTINIDEFHSFSKSITYMQKNTPTGYEMVKKPCERNELKAWYCTMLLMYMHLSEFNEIYHELTIVE